jgi:putative transposase
VDTEGLLITAAVTAADVQDQYYLYPLILTGKRRTPRLKHVWVDDGYQNNALVRLIWLVLLVVVEFVSRPPGTKGFHLLPRRWVVERTFAWLGRYRRLSKDYEFYPHSQECMIYLAMSHLMVRRLALMR